MTDLIRPPGRPHAEAGFDARRSLLDAAQRVFPDRGFHGSSLRAIATEAGVNPALIAYHFKDKKGLYEAMLDDVLAPLYERIDGGGKTPALEELMTTLYGFMAQHPWLPNLLLRDVLTPDSPMRDFFATHIASRNRKIIERLLALGQAEGQVRSDIAPSWLALATLSMMMFPLVAWPVVKQVFGFDGPETFQAEWLAQCQALLRAPPAGGTTA